jgi:hypothetical protein
MMVQSFLLFSQENKIVIDTLLIQKDSVNSDTTLRKPGVSKDAINMPITHTAKGYRRTDMVTGRFTLSGKQRLNMRTLFLKLIQLN